MTNNNRLKTPPIEEYIAMVVFDLLYGITYFMCIVKTMKISKKTLIVGIILIPLVLVVATAGKKNYDKAKGNVNIAVANDIAYDLAGASFVIPYANSAALMSELKIEDIIAQAKSLEKGAGGYNNVKFTYFPDGNVEAKIATGEIGYACVKLEGFGRGKCSTAKLEKYKV